MQTERDLKLPDAIFLGEAVWQEEHATDKLWIVPIPECIGPVPRQWTGSHCPMDHGSGSRYCLGSSLQMVMFQTCAPHNPGSDGTNSWILWGKSAIWGVNSLSFRQFSLAAERNVGFLVIKAIQSDISKTSVSESMLSEPRQRC